MTPDTPPPHLRAALSAREREQIEGMLGPIGDEALIHAVRDGRGRDFQRLEFLGDSVLDLVFAVHRWVEPDCGYCASHDTVHEASDRHLAEVAANAGLGSWLEWKASEQRIADLVETCVAACWLSDGWPQTMQFVELVVHPMTGRTLDALTHGVLGKAGRVARRVGSAVLELAAGNAVFVTYPEADEGTLSTARAVLHRASSIAAVAREKGSLDGVTFGHGDDDVVLSQVEDAMAATVGRSGADAGLDAALPFVTPGSG